MTPQQTGEIVQAAMTFADEPDEEPYFHDEIPDGNDHPIDAVRYAMVEDVLRG